MALLELANDGILSKLWCILRDERTDGKRQKLLGDKWEMARKVEKFARHNMISSAS